MKIKWEEPRGYDKKEMLYPDRKMLKYQGMLLADHSERIKDDERTTVLDDIHPTKDEL